MAEHSFLCSFPPEEATTFQEKSMGKGTYERTTGDGSDTVEAISVTSVKEQMMKRDADLALAMRLLKTVAHDVAASVTKFIESTGCNDHVKTLDLAALSVCPRDVSVALGLAGDITRVAHHLTLLQAALDRAARRRRSSKAIDRVR